MRYSQRVEIYFVITETFRVFSILWTKFVTDIDKFVTDISSSIPGT